MGTKKILNKDVSNVVEESLAGYLMAYRKYYKKVGEYNAFTYKGHRKDKVALVIGGGSGHEPLFTGYCGAGLADAVACGNVCASPNPELIMEAAKAVDQGKGVLFVYGNYAGDNLNFDMAEEMCQAEGMKTAHVREWDDFASAPKERITDRRGIAGDVYTIKIAGAACDAGLSLEEVVRITEKARDNTNTIGLATSPGTLPGNDKPTFEIADDEMEFGMGLHGEPGIERTKMMIHVVDAAGSEGRDPVDDIHKINAELHAYNAEIASRPQVIAANKIDLIYDDGESENPVERLKKEFEPQGIKVFPISGVTGAGIKELLYYVSTEIEKLDVAPIIFEPEYFPDEELINLDLPYTVEKEDGMYIVEGPKIEKMLGYTNLDSEKGFAFFQKFLKDTGILEQLEELGIEEGDTVKMYGLQFDYYK